MRWLRRRRELAEQRQHNATAARGPLSPIGSDRLRSIRTCADHGVVVNVAVADLERLRQNGAELTHCKCGRQLVDSRMWA